MRWQVFPDIWTFEDDIRPSAINPYTKTSAHSISVWSVEPDTWVHHTKENIIIRYFIKINELHHTIDDNGDFIEVLISNPPTREDFELQGFDNLGLLLSTKNGDNLRPLDKLNNQFSIVMGEYEPE